MAKRFEPRFRIAIPQGGVYVFPGIDQEQEEQAKPDAYARVLAPMNLLAAIFILAAAVLGLLNKTSLGTRVLLVGGLLVISIAVVGFPTLFRLFRDLRIQRADKNFIAEQHVQLDEIFGRLRIFTSRNDSRSLFSTLQSAYSGSTDYNVFERAIGGTQPMMEGWVESFRAELSACPAQTVEDFLRQCRTLTGIALEFSRTQVARAQKEALTGTPLNEHYIQRLETFGQDVNALFRDMEKWMGVISNYAKARLGSPDYWRSIPSPVFDRVNSFKRSAAASA